MAIRIDHTKTAYESFLIFFEGIFTSIKLKKKLIGKIERLRIILIAKKDSLIQVATDEKFISRTIEILNGCQRNYSDLQPSVEILNYCSILLRFIEKNILLRSNPKELFLAIKKIFEEIFSEIDFKITHHEQSTRRHVISHLEQLAVAKPEWADDVRAIIANLKKINKRNRFSLIYLIRAKEKIDKLYLS